MLKIGSLHASSELKNDPYDLDEEQRLEVLYSFGLIDSLAEEGYDDFSMLAAMICDTSMAMLSLVDRQCNWFISRHNVKTPSLPRDSWFCEKAMLSNKKLFEVQDVLLDPFYSKMSPVIDEKSIRFYAAWPLVNSEGYELGTLCVLDTVPKILSSEQRKGLEALGKRLTMQMRMGLQLTVTNKQNTTDALTGTANRRAFDSKIAYEWDQHLRHGRFMAIIIFDVDNFKSFNDRFGHKIGDNILMQVAASTTSVLRRADFFARYGGEEFVVVLEGTDLKSAVIVAEKIRKTIEFFPWSDSPITISSGVCSLVPSYEMTANEMVVRADIAMYEAKRSGKNKVCTWTDKSGLLDT